MPSHKKFREEDLVSLRDSLKNHFIEDKDREYVIAKFIEREGYSVIDPKAVGKLARSFSKISFESFNAKLEEITYEH